MSFETEISKTPERAGSLDKRVTRDLFLSFKYSQGNQPAQEGFFDLLSVYYRGRFGQDTLAGLDDTQLLESFSKLHLPKSHSDDLTEGTAPPDTRKYVQNRFMVEGSKFVIALKFPELADEFTVTPKDICAVTIFNDTIFQDPKTPRSYKDGVGDPHSSYFRQYILRQQPTGSEAFTSIFQDALGVYSNGELGSESMGALNVLGQKWNTNHPDKSFFADYE
jgi:hypothetical protein